MPLMDNVMELMANNSWLKFNGSENATVLFEQSPYTEATITVILISAIFPLAVPTLLFNISLLIAFYKSGQLYKPLGILQISLITEVLINKLFISIIISLYIPPALRHCSCSPLVSTIFSSYQLFSLTFRPVMYAILAIFQLLIIKGRKKIVKFKSAFVSIGIAIVVGLLFAIEIGILTNLNGELQGCTDFNCPGQRETSLVISATCTSSISYIIIVWIPSFMILVFATSWSCTVFRKFYTGGDDQLSRRQLSMPVILPAVLALSTIVNYAV